MELDYLKNLNVIIFKEEQKTPCSTYYYYAKHKDNGHSSEVVKEAITRFPTKTKVIMVVRRFTYSDKNYSYPQF